MGNLSSQNLIQNRFFTFPFDKR